ncbi:hypothetical protein T4A_7162 [Trichinella pseudospiralis]|uniref:Uncharacterized protein n=1 Tax=Trichinella pseudospiralis TaxID=6337 RepID=A0A0V1EUM9_TRIPS|nr:hypothetical protein T4A_7162 [Trichinella pseudospiralis]KRZ44621.1 hypothetical protein T4C_5877 [Trichinella pseudospiralis]
MESQNFTDDQGKCKCTYEGISSSIKMINHNLESTLLLLTKGKDIIQQFCTENEKETAHKKSGNIDFDAILNQFEQQPSSSQSTTALSFDDEESCFNLENMGNKQLTCEQTTSEVINGADEGCLDDKQQCLLNILSHIARNSILVQEQVRKALYKHELLQKELLLMKRRHSTPSDLSSTSIYASIISEQSSVVPRGTPSSIYKSELLNSDYVRLNPVKPTLSPSFSNKPPKRLPADVTFLNSILPNGVWSSKTYRRTKYNQYNTESSKRRRLKMDQEIT